MCRDGYGLGLPTQGTIAAGDSSSAYGNKNEQYTAMNKDAEDLGSQSHRYPPNHTPTVSELRVRWRAAQEEISRLSAGIEFLQSKDLTMEFLIRSMANLRSLGYQV